MWNLLLSFVNAQNFLAEDNKHAKNLGVDGFVEVSIAGATIGTGEVMHTRNSTLLRR